MGGHVHATMPMRRSEGQLEEAGSLLPSCGYQDTKLKSSSLAAGHLYPLGHHATPSLFCFEARSGIAQADLEPDTHHGQGWG